MKSIKVISITLLYIIGIAISSQAQLAEQQLSDMVKYSDILNSVLKETVVHYVDSIDVEAITEEAINGMLKDLDPYSEYIPAKEMPDFQIMTTGEYGGIGSVISMKDSSIIIREPYEGMPAVLSGLIPGDKILYIDGESMEGKDTKQASDLLKGQPNTKLTLTIERIGESKPRKIEITRKRIHINPVVYSGVLENNIGYIYLSSFTVDSGRAVKEAFLELMNKNISALVFDVRDNGGGVVDECLEILNLFMAKGDTLLSMKGKIKQYDRVYKAMQAPIAPDMPIAILINGNSASASEIVAGAVQDLDRGILVGEKTYGKGLVQITRSLPHGGQLKLTSAKYYIPSGRCIQRIDYSKKEKADSDTVPVTFYTRNGRPVYDGGGISPDFEVKEENVPSMIFYLEAKSIFFDFVAQWRVDNPVIASPSEFEVSEELYNEFKEYVKSVDFTYDLQSERTLETLKRAMELEGYKDIANEEFQSLEKLLKPDLDRDLELHKKIISKHLAYNIMQQYYYHKGTKMYELRDDVVLNKAILQLQTNVN
ncbi:carboxyl-terminal processing protease [Dysgonomonadaceae bacterium PH5-43]|nr:carboxyl-terminal processing protease [Dysgonomonadaceae bacterium PH5-43]